MATEFTGVKDVAEYLAERAGSAATDLIHAEPLSGGYLNRVWRVRMPRDLFGAIVGAGAWRGEGRASATLIVKHAPPYAARRPDIALDPGRLRFEARALDYLRSTDREIWNCGPDDRATGSAPLKVRVPQLYLYDASRAVILMEDLGAGLDLGDAIAAASEASLWDFRAIGGALGRWLATLHSLKISAGDANEFRNDAVQATRAEIQYRGAADSLRRVGVADWRKLGERAAAFGQRLLGPGVGLTMGDLWPASVLLADDDRAGIGLIDWEFAHYGRPVQDVAHLAAHLFMRVAVGRKASEGDRAAAVGRAFLETYLRMLGDQDESLHADSAIHFACEILMRTAGPFQAGYLFENQTMADPAFRAVVNAAADALRDPDWRLTQLFI
ncbi:MAG: aminoglycoside phosphotransferase family protein [bacterium]|nr:aminoglycoside phosphotransferase family protein [bacterium]